jgi:hypothetical protein
MFCKKSKKSICGFIQFGFDKQSIMPIMLAQNSEKIKGNKISFGI